MRVSVIIPVFNEVATLAEIVRRLRAVGELDIGEIILVDDRSTDGTRALMQSEFEEPLFKKFYHASNLGKGAALRTGFAAATGDIVIIQDADLEYDPADLPRLVMPIEEDRADVVFGSRFSGSGRQRVAYLWQSLGNRVLTMMSNAVTDLDLTDMECCYKLFRRDVLEHISIQEDRFGVEPELTVKASRLGARICEAGISYHGRSYAEGKKIGWKDGVRAIYAIFKYGLFSRAAKIT